MRHLASWCGVMAGIGGFVHGAGEVAQGRGTPEGVVVDSWTSGPIAENLGGEPAMTLMPDLVLTGWLTMSVSVAVAVWALWFLDTRMGGTVLALLSVAMLLVGGGFGPPMLGLLAGLVAGSAHRAGRPHPSRRRAGQRWRRLAAAWPTLFWVCAVNAGFLVLGSFTAAVVLDLRVPDLFVYSLFLAVASMPLAAVAGIAAARGGSR